VLAGRPLWRSDAPGGATVRVSSSCHPGNPGGGRDGRHRHITLEGDESTSKVLADQRLNGFEVEAGGRFTAPEHFLIDPFHTRGLLARKDGKLKLITLLLRRLRHSQQLPGPCVCWPTRDHTRVARSRAALKLFVSTPGRRVIPVWKSVKERAGGAVLQPLGCS